MWWFFTIVDLWHNHIVTLRLNYFLWIQDCVSKWGDRIFFARGDSFTFSTETINFFHVCVRLLTWKCYPVMRFSSDSAKYIAVLKTADSTISSSIIYRIENIYCGVRAITLANNSKRIDRTNTCRQTTMSTYIAKTSKITQNFIPVWDLMSVWKQINLMPGWNRHEIQRMCIWLWTFEMYKCFWN